MIREGLVRRAISCEKGNLCEEGDLLLEGKPLRQGDGWQKQ